MSDFGNDAAAEGADVAFVEPQEEVTDLMSAVRQVLKKALIHDGVARGLHESAKCLEAKKGRVCFLAEQCSEPAYKKLIQALCKEHNCPIIDVPEAKDLGQWVGLCKFDKDGEARKIVKASCVVVTDFGEESDGFEFLQTHIQSLKK